MLSLSSNWARYEIDLDCNITDPHSQLHRGAYRALPSRCVYIPKPVGRLRPLAIVALEDKIVQRAPIAALNADLRFWEGIIGERTISAALVRRGPRCQWAAAAGWRRRQGNEGFGAKVLGHEIGVLT
jgi:hypothetical protein